MEHCDEVSVVRNNKISLIHVMYIPVYIYVWSALPTFILRLTHQQNCIFGFTVYMSRFLNTNTLFTSTVCQFFAIQGFISLCWKMTFLGNWKKFTDSLMKLGKFYYLAYIKNTGLIHILNTSYVSPFPHFGNNYKGFSVNAFPIHTMIWHPAVFHWHSTVRSVGSMTSVTLLISA